MNGRCTACGSAMTPFYEVDKTPVNSCIQLASSEEAREFPQGKIVLGFCNNCEFVRNLAFDPKAVEYSSRYEETQGCSPTFDTYQRKLVEDLVQRYELRDKDILEVGCGKGEFLALLCKMGGNRGTGFDPSYDASRGVLDDVANVSIICDLYSRKYHGYKADFVCSKMTLEHIGDVSEFVANTVSAMSEDGKAILYIQVPNAERIFRDCAFEDIYYEHCSYFNLRSLTLLMQRHGLEVLNAYTAYGEQYLAVEARLDQDDDNDPGVPVSDLTQSDGMQSFIESYVVRTGKAIELWNTRLVEYSSRGETVLWGGGSKAVAFLSAVSSSGLIKRAVDINPKRRGHFIPPAGIPIVVPEDLCKDPPATVIVMNPIYRDEVRRTLNDYGLSPKVVALSD